MCLGRSAARKPEEEEKETIVTTREKKRDLNSVCRISGVRISHFSFSPSPLLPVRGGTLSEEECARKKKKEQKVKQVSESESGRMKEVTLSAPLSPIYYSSCRIASKGGNSPTKVYNSNSHRNIFFFCKAFFFISPRSPERNLKVMLLPFHFFLPPPLHCLLSSHKKLSAWMVSPFTSAPPTSPPSLELFRLRRS